MEQNQTEQLLRQPIAPKLTQNLEQIRTIAEGSSDLLVNECPQRTAGGTALL